MLGYVLGFGLGNWGSGKLLDEKQSIEERVDSIF